MKGENERESTVPFLLFIEFPVNFVHSIKKGEKERTRRRDFAFTREDIIINFYY